MASITLTVPAAAVPRIQAAIGFYQDYGRDATTAEIKDAIIQNIKQIVKSYETQAAHSAAQATIVPLEDIT